MTQDNNANKSLWEYIQEIKFSDQPDSIKWKLIVNHALTCTNKPTDNAGQVTAEETLLKFYYQDAMSTGIINANPLHEFATVKSSVALDAMKEYATLVSEERCRQLQQQLEIRDKQLEEVKADLARDNKEWLELGQEYVATITDLKTKSDKLAYAIKKALSIKDLWLISGWVSDEHENEAVALKAMHDTFEEALTAHQEQKQGGNNE